MEAETASSAAAVCSLRLDRHMHIAFRVMRSMPSMISKMLIFTLLSPVLILIQQNWVCMHSSKEKHIIFHIESQSSAFVSGKWQWAGKNCDMLPKDDPECHDALAHASLAISVAASIGAIVGFLLAPMVGRLSCDMHKSFVKGLPQY